ncbi:MAG TPA: DUF6498-containing protein [Gallionellaceae bacterium]
MLNARRKFFRFTFNAAPESGTPLERPRTIPLVAGLIVAGMFAVFAAVWWSQFSRLHLSGSNGVFDLMGGLFSLFWLMGWSIGVLFLAALTLAFLFYREAAYLSGGRLVSVMTVGPLGLRAEYELARIRNLRVASDPDGKTRKILFDCDGIACSFGNMMQPEVAERNLQRVQRAVEGAGFGEASDFAPATPAAAPVDPLPAPAWVPPASRGLPWASMLALVAANLIPLFMVWSGAWTLGQVMLLFWAESTVVGFFTLLKMAVVAKWWAIFPGMFFVGHFGGFMAGHFMFIYMLFLRDGHAGLPDSAALLELGRLFAPLTLALLALVLSHGISFVLNFIKQREYEGEKVQSLMMAPYGRIMVMHFTLLLGGWVVMLLHDPAPVISLLVLLKIMADLRGHYGSHARQVSGAQDAN